MAKDHLERVRRFCLALPEVEEKLSHGAPTFFVKKKVFVMFADNHHNDGRIAIWSAATNEVQQALIESEPDKGSSVHLYLPRSTREAAVGEQEEAFAQTPVRHPPTRILVVEDDPRVLNQTMAALGELGHLPIACDHPSKAIRLLTNNPDIGLIVSDVLMPDMTGPELVKSLPVPLQHIPVLFVTGYTGDTGESADFQGHVVLRKPYTLAALGQALATALSGSHLSGTAAAAE